MRSLQWFVSPGVNPEAKKTALVQALGAVVLGDATYPETAWYVVTNETAGNPTAPGASAAIAHAVMETARNRQNALNAHDAATADMMTQRLLTLSQLRAAWLGGSASTDIQTIISQVQSDSSIFNFGALGAGLGNVAKLAALGAAIWFALSLRKRSA